MGPPITISIATNVLQMGKVEEDGRGSKANSVSGTNKTGDGHKVVSFASAIARFGYCIVKAGKKRILAIIQ